ncbi:MAG: hypothetical protein LQ351_002676 [Letrouitia transgressa]|nr:MAG: hypothetical protein LQ351_002676 [Letrouitia transgressa]
MDNLQSSLFVASRRLNDLTGYTGIESLKSSIAAQESLLSSTRARLQAARAAYTAAIQTRSASQREVNELLQRKHAWSALDLERFTALYRSDHANEQAEAKAQAELGRVEREAEESGERLSQSILTRYHEEQIWSDKIRRMSTWGTWGLMGVNVLLFLVFQIGVEPWRRRRLVKGFEEKVVEALERGEEKGGTLTVSNGAGFKPTVEKEEDVQFRGEEDATPSARVEMEIDKEVDREVVAAQASMLSSIYGTSLAALKDLFSDRKITLRKVDVTLMVAEGAAAGMVVVGVIASLLRSR